VKAIAICELIALAWICFCAWCHFSRIPEEEAIWAERESTADEEVKA